jgi:hypothetical protein
MTIFWKQLHHVPLEVSFGHVYYPISNGIPNMVGLHLARSLRYLYSSSICHWFSFPALAIGQNMGSGSVFLVSGH